MGSQSGELRGRDRASGAGHFWRLSNELPQPSPSAKEYLDRQFSPIISDCAGAGARLPRDPQRLLGKTRTRFRSRSIRRGQRRSGRSAFRPLLGVANADSRAHRDGESGSMRRCHRGAPPGGKAQQAAIPCSLAVGGSGNATCPRFCARGSPIFALHPAPPFCLLR